ncbi:MAG: VCBS repeat-containing protein, partial [Pirellula sp.]
MRPHLNHWLRSRLGLIGLIPLFSIATWISDLDAQDVSFERIQLSNEFHSEGGTFGDYDSDGKGDVAVGPWIYWGPDYQAKSLFYEGKPYDPAGYSKNFFMYSDDIDGDQSVDIVVLGFPGEESWWYKNPGKASSRGSMWQRNTIIDVTDNESPTFVDIDGDGTKDLVCSSKGRYGYASHAGRDPKQPWKFNEISPNNKYHKFTHGLGVGDVNNDKRLDLIEKDGWWENPGRQSEGELWKHHPYKFSQNGGSQMFAYDLDGDSKNEVVTGLIAHGFGLAYYHANDALGT